MLDNNTLETIYNGLRSDDKGTLLNACKLAGEKVPEMEMGQLRMIADALVGQFYLDTDDNLEYVEVIECASDTLVKMGADTVNILVDGLTDTDLQADFQIAKTLGRIGAPAIAVLKDMFHNETDPFIRGVALLALSKIDDPALIEIFNEVVSAMDHENQELRSMAVEALGRMIECIGGQCLLPEAANHAFDKLMMKLPDPHAGSRAKAVKAIGLLSKMEYLDEDQKSRALAAIKSILGTDQQHNWDRAFIVRKNAEEAFKMITGSDADVIAADELCKIDD